MAGGKLHMKTIVDDSQRSKVYKTPAFRACYNWSNSFITLFIGRKQVCNWNV